MGEFDGRVIVVTGATGGLGGAVARVFLEAGAIVAGVSRGPAGQASAGRKYLEVTADVSTPDGARMAVDTVLAATGRIDALAHLVGGFAGGQPVAETTDDVWNRMMSLNLNAAFYTMRAVLPHMLQAGRGRIVAVGSRTGVEPAAGLSAYGASKAALITLVRTIAAEVRLSGITANVVLPSVIDTPANRAAMPAADYTRWVKPESVARLILWLASDAAADTNGALAPVYGRA